MNYVISVLESLVDDYKIAIERIGLPGYQPHTKAEYEDMIFNLEHAIKILKTNVN